MNPLTWLSRRRFTYDPLITIEVSRGRLLSNLAEFRKMAPKPDFAPHGSVAPVLKSNAYGHGLLEVARILEKDGGHIPFFIVDSYYEAVALRARSIKAPLLIIGYTRPETITASCLKDTAFAVTSLDTLYALSGSKRASIHLKIDTGMRRQGILPEEIDKAIELIRDNKSLVLEGVCTHLCDADNSEDESFTESQISAWNKAVKHFKAAFPHIRYIHAAATDGSRYYKDIEANVLRLGIGLYGLSENAALNASLDLRPVMSMKTIVTCIKRLKSGETVGYGKTFKAKNDMTIATVPVGYFEGLDRRLSSEPNGDARGIILVGEKRLPCPIVGRVSMNITTIDVSAVHRVKAGDQAVIFSDVPSDGNSIASTANRCGTITYEIAVKIPAHLKRVVVD